MKFDMTPVRGTVDYLPTEMEMRDKAVQTILEIFKQNGFLHIKTPILENLELLTSGDSGDNQKLMFKTVKRGASLDLSKANLTEKDIVEEGLRYDLTVPLVRFFANNREKLTYPFKSIQIDEAFRAERPQKGRVRQFTQCDIDILGDTSPLAEIELLTAGCECYQKLGFENITVKVNDRRVLNELIGSAGFNMQEVPDICLSLDKFDKIGTDGVKSELLQKGYNEKALGKLISVFETLKTAKSNDESFKILSKYQISDENINNLKTIIEFVQKHISPNFKVVFDASIIRGQGYYTGTVYEVFDSEFGRAIGGGGRYDKMVEKFTGTPVPAVGFSIGLYSTLMLMSERNKGSSTRKLALVYDNSFGVDEIINAKANLISDGYEVSIFAHPKNFANFVQKLKLNGYEKLVKMSDINDIKEI